MCSRTWGRSKFLLVARKQLFYSSKLKLKLEISHSDRRGHLQLGKAHLTPRAAVGQRLEEGNQVSGCSRALELMCWQESEAGAF